MFKGVQSIGRSFAKPFSIPSFSLSLLLLRLCHFHPVPTLQPQTIIQRCICCHCRICPVRYTIVDFTRLKLVQGKKEEEAKATAAKKALAAVQENDEDIMASYDAGDDEDIVF